jgi:Tol biopolymer transport system component
MNAHKFCRRFGMLAALRCTALLAVSALTCAVAEPGATNSGRIAFVGDQSGSFQLYTMNPDGSEMVQITSLAATPFESWSPSFSPDGRRIAFCYGGLDASGNLRTEIYVINVDGSGLTQLTHDGQFDCFSRWSPEGTRIVFGRQDPVTQQLVVATMAADGTDIQEFTTRFWGIGLSGFTADGRHIVWDTQQAGFVSVIWRMDADGAQKVRLTQPELRAGASAPSPDGRHIAFVNNVNSPTALSNSIFVMNLDGTGIHQITRPVGISHDVSENYSPDGTQIVFASDRLSTDGGLDIFTMNADGSNLVRIATGVTVGGCADDNCVTPAWGRKP